ncbi:TetR/AcrR family transcriptional regulator [Rudaea sp.]|uniref:TetR/AcrR family transcriptional regulator n=1 Tax=Rudaea sp. TaxID=2136325 RepID=UPI002ED0705E
MSDRKSQLIDRTIDYLLENGLAGLSLRPLAAGIGTSARLLIFHFGSKEGLVEEVLTEVQERMRNSLAAIASSRSSVPGETPMKRCWRWASDKRNLPYLRLLYEAHFIAVRTPGTYERYLNQSSLNWIEFIASRLPESISSAATATLCGAVFDGLIIELLSTGDLRRTTRALDDFIALLQREHEARTRAARLEERARKTRSRT